MTDSFNISKKSSLSTANKNLNQDLNLDTEYIKCATTALIREYLARKVILIYLILIKNKLE
jgi:hypothetical protein